MYFTINSCKLKKVQNKHIYNKRIMDNIKAVKYDRLLRTYQGLENQLSRVPKLSIEEQSREIMAGVEFNQTNQSEVNQIRGKMDEVSEVMKSLF